MNIKWQISENVLQKTITKYGQCGQGKVIVVKKQRMLFSTKLTLYVQTRRANFCFRIF
jgi:hypothetical protein